VNGCQLSADYTVDDPVIVRERGGSKPGCSPHARLRFRSSVSCRDEPTSDKKPHSKRKVPGTLLIMKILIALAAVGIIAGIVYKVLTTEIPIDES
jgi:hypothetical protein